MKSTKKIIVSVLALSMLFCMPVMAHGKSHHHHHHHKTADAAVTDAASTEDSSTEDVSTENASTLASSTLFLWYFKYEIKKQFRKKIITNVRVIFTNNLFAPPGAKCWLDTKIVLSADL